jgi:hypothetical protein
VTALAALLSDRDRERLEGRLAELRGLDREMRKRGTLASPAEPEPLHRTATTKKETTSS